MNNNKNRLSELDIKDITSKLGRYPTEIEISFIEMVLSNELEMRGYLRILSRLNNGAKREVNNKIEFDDKSNLFVNTGFKILNQDKSLLINRDETKYINKLNGISTVLDNIVIKSPNNSDVEKIIKKELVNRKGSNAIGSRFIKEDENEIIFSSTIGLKEKINANVKSQLKNSLVYKINFGKRYFQKNVTQLIKIINALNNEAWFLFAKSINWNGLGVALIKLIKETSHGISIIKEISSESINSHFSDDKTLSILIVIQQDNFPQLSLFCKKNDLSINEIGILVSEPVIHLNNKNNTLINLPATVFDLQYNVNVQHFIRPKIGEDSYKNVLKKYKSGSFTNQLIKLLTKISEDDALLKFHTKNRKLTKNISSYGLYSIDDQIVLTTADKNYLIDISPRLSGRISVANAGRRLACTGTKPIAIIIQNIFPKINNSSLWTASELLQGQEEAIREMEVEIGSRTIDTVENYWYQNISAIGTHHQDSVKMDISFKHEGDFISLLGSHRGELGGSAYERSISANGSQVLPNVDLRMENRLQDVVRQGINTNLIKSAVNVSTGGISIAIAKSLIASAGGIGARIHLSRKLKNEELLFGETQGLVVVSLSENDIMEFERICMTVGVPSTTIGRVTDNNLFTFNDVIKTKVDRLRACN